MQHAAALKTTEAMNPDEDFRSEGTTSSSPTPTPTPTPTPSTVASSRPRALSLGAIVGISIGAVAVLLIAIAMIYTCGRQSRYAHYPISQHPQDPSTPISPGTIYASSPGGGARAFEQQRYAEEDGCGIVSVKGELSGSQSPRLSRKNTPVVLSTVAMNDTAKLGSIEMETIPEGLGMRRIENPGTPVEDGQINPPLNIEIPDVLR